MCPQSEELFVRVVLPSRLLPSRCLLTLYAFYRQNKCRLSLEVSDRVQNAETFRHPLGQALCVAAAHVEPEVQSVRSLVSKLGKAQRAAEETLQMYPVL